jgi:hypothetical protein
MKKLPADPYSSHSWDRHDEVILPGDIEGSWTIEVLLLSNESDVYVLLFLSVFVLVMPF